LVVSVVAWATLSGTGWAQTTQPKGETAAAPEATAAETPAAPAPTPAAAAPSDPVEEWIKKAKNPVPWWKWGADWRMREVYQLNPTLLNTKGPEPDAHWQRYRGRFWSTITPVEDVEFNFRIEWEGRYYDKPDSRDNWTPANVYFDNLNVKVNLKKFTGLPVTIQGGRMDLQLGDRWLVMDGTPLDGSGTFFFDAIRVTTDVEPIKTKFDLIFLEQNADAEDWFYPIANHNLAIVEQDELGAIAWVTNKSIPKTELNGYFMYKRGRPFLVNGYDAEIYTFGLLVAGDITPKLRYSVDLAGQFGHKNGANLCALGSLDRLTYSFKDKLDSQLYTEYEYLSGDDPGTRGTNEAFDVLWGRWTRFSEMYVYTMARETRSADYTNLHRLGFGYLTHPMKKMELLATYHLLFSDTNPLGDMPRFSQTGNFRGQLLTASLKYKFTSFLTGTLTNEFLFPGDYYTDDSNDPSVFLQAELMFSF
jgi:hypothetical protein